MNYWVVVYRCAWALLVLLAIFGVVCVFLPQSHALRAYQQRRVTLEQENRELEMSIRELVNNQTQFQTDPAFVERTAREAGMIKTNEFIYKLAPDAQSL